MLFCFLYTSYISIGKVFIHFIQCKKCFVSTCTSDSSLNKLHSLTAGHAYIESAHFDRQTTPPSETKSGVIFMSTVSWQTAPPSIYIYIPAASAGYIAYSVLCVYIYIYMGSGGAAVKTRTPPRSEWRQRWFCGMEKMASYMFPVRPEDAETAGVPPFELPQECNVHQVVGNSMHCGNAAVVILCCVACIRAVPAAERKFKSSKPTAKPDLCDSALEVERILHEDEKNHYAILGADMHVTKAEIKRLFHSLILLVHPDKTSTPGCGEAFARVHKAWEVGGGHGQILYEQYTYIFIHTYKENYVSLDCPWYF
jgi:hypothetical protein